MKQDMKRILITGATGQIGTELTRELRKKYGVENVVASDIKKTPTEKFEESGPFEIINVTNPEQIEQAIKKYEIDSVFHLAALLSATGEEHPIACLDVNIGGSLNVLKLGLKLQLNRIIIPSSIAVWGPGTPSVAPQETYLNPTTMYGVTKVCIEQITDYFVRRFGLDCRGLRYPGIISAETFPGGGTTDYAVAIYYDAVKYGHYDCFVRESTRLPMMYMPDCLKATIDLAEADFSKLKRHNDFNVGSMSFTAGELAASIKKYMPDFTCNYKPDKRQEIADSWPDSVDDSAARSEWGWKPAWGLDEMTKDMLEKLKEKHAQKLI